MDGTIDFLRGGSMVAFIGIAIFFYRSWRSSRDLLFMFFGAAFALMSVSQPILMWTNDKGELSPAAYWLRVAAYSLIILGIVAKNWPPRGKSAKTDDN